MEKLPTTRSCFVCGVNNPIGLKLKFYLSHDTDGSPQVETSIRFQSTHVGFVSWVHGGLIATVLDEAMFWAAATRLKTFVACAHLEVRYLKPIHPDTEIRIKARAISHYKTRLVETQAQATNPSGEVFVQATGKYIQIPAELADGFRSDLVGHLPWDMS